MTVRQITACDDPDWNSLHELFGVNVDDEGIELNGILEGLEMVNIEPTVLAVVDNIQDYLACCSESVCRLPDGRIYMLDSNDGQHAITEGRVDDVDAFLDKLETYLTTEA